jgi:hypothetical protein
MAYGLDGTYSSVYDEVVSSIPQQLRFPIPDGIGDGGLIVDFDEATPSKARKGLEGYRYRFVTEVEPQLQLDDHAFLLKALYSLDRKGPVESDVSTLSVIKPRMKPKFKIRNGIAPQLNSLPLDK